MVQEISPRDLAKQLANGHDVLLLDVRQGWENEIAALPDSLLIPLNDLPRRCQEITPGKPIVVYCHHGVRSLSAAAFLDRLGLPNVSSLAGGIDGWSCEIDPTLPRY